MSNSKVRILAIDPGIRFMGVALLEDESLLYHGVEVFGNKKNSRDSLAAATETVLRFIKDFKPSVLAMERTFIAGNKRTVALNMLFAELQTIARQHKLKLYVHAPMSVKKHVTGYGRAGKVAVGEAVAKIYPELQVYLRQNRQWKTKFHANMFDAIAVGLLTAKQLKEE